jgi:hypothetical protein
MDPYVVMEPESQKNYNKQKPLTIEHNYEYEKKILVMFSH